MNSTTPTTCPECGAPLPEAGTCRDLFHELLALEGQLPGVPGSTAHFYAVSAYVLQHPAGFNLTPDAFADLRRSVADALEGRATLEELRRRGRREWDGARRVTRRAGEPELTVPRPSWPVTIACVDGTDPAAYGASVREWARSVRETLDDSERGRRGDGVME